MFVIISSKPHDGKTKTIHDLINSNNNYKVLISVEKYESVNCVNLYDTKKSVREHVEESIKKGFIDFYIDDWFLFNNGNLIPYNFYSIEESVFNDLYCLTKLHNINIYITDQLPRNYFKGE